MDFIRSLMEDSYTLVWVNYDDNLNENLDVIETCMKEKSAMTLYDKTDDWYRDARWYGVSQILEDIKSNCINDGFDEDAVEEFMDENRDDIVNIIYERDDSDAFRFGSRCFPTMTVSTRIGWNRMEDMSIPTRISVIWWMRLTSILQR